MYDDSVEFLVIVFLIFLGIALHSVKGNDDVTIYCVAFIVVEGYDVGIVVMSEEFIVHLEYFRIITEEVSYFAYLISMR